MSSSFPLFPRQHDYLIAIDSDGCAFDTMEIKHKECFIPMFIKDFGLQGVSRFARECAEFVNLYSQSRGVNRFPAYLKTLELMANYPEIIHRKFNVPQMPGLAAWIARETKLSSKSVKSEAEKTGDPDLKIASQWSQNVDEMIAEMVHDVPPFPFVRETLEKVSKQADIVVCSATPTPALQKEWDEHGISSYVRIIYGQEAGSKKEILKQMLGLGYSSGKIIMLGDSPGDMQAAKAVGALSYPIIPNKEADSWEQFFQNVSQRFFEGSYAGELHQKFLAEYDQVLPVNPPWQNKCNY